MDWSVERQEAEQKRERVRGKGVRRWVLGFDRFGNETMKVVLCIEMND